MRHFWTPPGIFISLIFKNNFSAAAAAGHDLKASRPYHSFPGARLTAILSLFALF
jgi:hypothetical protein